jgi:hypothetical protein
MQISRQKYRQAHIAQQTINKAVAVLSELTLDTMNGDTELRAEIDGFIATLGFIREQHQEVIDAAELLKKSVDSNLINRCMERIRKLNRHLQNNAVEIQQMQYRYERRLQESLELRVLFEQHKPLDTAPGKEDEIRVKQERTLLELELNRINAFLATSPFFDTSLLIGTHLEQFIHPEAAAA